MHAPTPAAADDAAAIVTLRDTLAEGLLAQGIRQWHPGEVDVDDVRDQIARGEWYVVRDAGIIGTLRLIWSDQRIWADLVGPDDNHAGYVHGLMVDPDQRGTGLGQSLLAWAEDQMRAHGRRVARVDCVASNERLRAHYRALGYTERGVRDVDPRWHPLMRFERDL